MPVNYQTLLSRPNCSGCPDQCDKEIKTPTERGGGVSKGMQPLNSIPRPQSFTSPNGRANPPACFVLFFNFIFTLSGVHATSLSLHRCVGGKQVPQKTEREGRETGEVKGGDQISPPRDMAGAPTSRSHSYPNSPSLPSAVNHPRPSSGPQ